MRPAGTAVFKFLFVVSRFFFTKTTIVLKQSGPSTPRMRRKRLRSLTPSEAGLNSSDDDYLLRSPLSKRKKLAKDRLNASKLKESISSAEFGYALPTVPSPREEDEEDEDEEEESIFGDDDEDDFLARELEEEMG